MFKKLAFFAKSKRKLDYFAAMNKYKNIANVQYGTNSLPNQIIQHNFISIYCDDLMSIVKAFAIYVRENSSRMTCNAKKLINFRN